MITTNSLPDNSGSRPAGFRWNRSAIVVGMLAMLGFAIFVFVLHRNQASKIASAMLDDARNAKQRGEWEIALSAMARYLQYRPEDAAAFVELAKWYGECPVDRVDPKSVLDLLREAMLRAQTLPELKSSVPALQRSFLNRCIEYRQYSDALGWMLGPASPDTVADSFLPDLAVCRYRSWTQDGSDRVKDAAGSAPWLVEAQSLSILDHLANAWQQSPGVPRIADSLADAVLQHPELVADSRFASLSRQEQIQQARSWIEECVRSNPDAPEAWHAFVQHAAMLGIENLDEMLDELLSKFPKDGAILIGVGRIASQSDAASATDSQAATNLPREALARKSLQRMRDLSESSKGNALPGTYFAIMGDLSWRIGNPTEAIDQWKHGLKHATPPRAFLVLRCMRGLIDLRRFQDAALMLESVDETILGDAPHLSDDDFLRLSIDAKRVRIQYNLATNQFQALADVLSELASNAKIPSVARAEFLASAGIAELNNERWEQAGTWLDQASSLSPSDDSLHRLAASAWIQTNRIDRALKHATLVAAKTPQDWLQIASLHLSLQCMANENDLGWEAFDEALKSAATKAPAAVDAAGNTESRVEVAPWQVEALRWEAHAQRSHGTARLEAIQHASSELEQLCRQNPDQQRLWLHTAQLLQRWGQSDAASALLDAYSVASPDSSLARRLDAERSLKRGAISDAITACQLQLTKTPEDNAWLELWLRCEESTPDVHASWDRIAAWCSDEPARWRRFAISTIGRLQSSHRRDALATNNRASVSPKIELLSRLEIKLRDLEGDLGTDWKWVRSRKLLLQADLDAQASLEEVAEIARMLDSQRPNWSETHTLSGLLSNRLGDYRTALRSFERAIESGDQRWEAYERLIDGLYREGLVSQAADWIRRMKEQANLSYRIASIALQLDIDSNRSWLERTKQGIQFRPQDPLAWVWYAQALISAKNMDSIADQTKSEDSEIREQIDAAWLRALELERDDRWAAHFAALDYYATTQQRERLESMRERLSISPEPPSPSGWLLRGLLEQELGNWNDAEICYERSLQAGGNALGVGLQLGRLKLLQGDVSSAINRFEELLKNYASDEDLRNAAAVAWAVRGTAKDWEKILALLQSNKRESTPGDRRTLARLLLQRGDARDLQRAQSLLDGLLLNPATATDEDRFQLAILHLRMHELERRNAAFDSIRSSETNHLKVAQQHFQVLTDRPDAPANYLFAYANLLLDQEQWEIARRPIQRLQALAPTSADTLLASARLARHCDGVLAASEMIAQWLNAPSTESAAAQSEELLGLRRLTQASNAYWAIHAWPEAESATRRLLAANREFGQRLLVMQSEASSPEIRQRALAMLLESSASPILRAEAFQVLRLLNTQSYSGPVLAAAEAVLQQFAESQPEDLEFLLFFSDRMIAKGEIEQAIAILRRIVERDPRNALAANNLATLLSESPGKLDEAIQTIANAIDRVGPHPILLDTHGTILVQADRVAEALPLLERAARQAADPRYAFHWMVGLAKANQMEAARKVWKSIDVEALKGMRLSNEDREALQQWLSASP